MEKTLPVPRAAHAARSGKNQVETTKGKPSQSGQFFSLAIDMSWKLAVVVLVPILVGVQLDKMTHWSPALTLVGLGLAFLGAGLVMWSTLKTANGLPVPKLTEAQRRKIRKSYEEEDEE